MGFVQFLANLLLSTCILITLAKLIVLLLCSQEAGQVSSKLVQPVPNTFTQTIPAYPLVQHHY